MITSLNENNAAAYSQLFELVNQTLGTNVENLTDYFANIKTITDSLNNHPNFIRLPIDENYFVINANTRDITVPKEFATGVAISGDNKAETVFFIVDRYFDMMDLAKQNIAIEYISATGNRGYAPAIFIDTTMNSGELKDKIIFGWCIDEKITEGYGRVNFSVRFYTIDSDKKKISYSLSTKPAAILINKSIYSDGKQATSIDELMQIKNTGAALENELKARLNPKGELGG